MAPVVALAGAGHVGAEALLATLLRQVASGAAAPQEARVAYGTKKVSEAEAEITEEDIWVDLDENKWGARSKTHLWGFPVRYADVLTVYIGRATSDERHRTTRPTRRERTNERIWVTQDTDGGLPSDEGRKQQAGQVFAGPSRVQRNQ